MRLRYPPNVKIVKMPCTGKIDALYIMRAFENGADGVYVAGCHEGNCHFLEGNINAKRRVKYLKKVLDEIGIGGDRLEMFNMSAAEGPRFAEVANLMTEPGETDGYTVLEHVLVIERHLGLQLFDYVIYNTSPVPEHLKAGYASQGATPMVLSPLEIRTLERLDITPIGVPLISEHPAGKIRHHPDRLAAAIMALAQGKLSARRGRAEAGGL